MCVEKSHPTTLPAAIFCSPDWGGTKGFFFFLMWLQSLVQCPQQQQNSLGKSSLGAWGCSTLADDFASMHEVLG